MNAARRKLIVESLSKVEEILSVLEGVRDDEQEAYDNMPESLQQAERGEQSSEAISHLEDACSNLEFVRDALDNVGAE